MPPPLNNTRILKLPIIIALCLFLASPNIWTAVFCLVFNIANKLLSGFHKLDFLMVPNVPTSIGILSVIPSKLDTMAASIITLYYC